MRPRGKRGGEGRFEGAWRHGLAARGRGQSLRRRRRRSAAAPSTASQAAPVCVSGGDARHAHPALPFAPLPPAPPLAAPPAPAPVVPAPPALVPALVAPAPVLKPDC